MSNLVKTKFYEFSQNNSGGSFDIDDGRGIGAKVWIEAVDAQQANDRALNLGIYFNGIDSGSDCPCCGDRWYPVYEYDAEDQPLINEEYDFNWHDIVYVHMLNGSIERIREER